MPKDYNFIYEQLVDSEDDIHGIIAYSVYKRQKIQYIKDFHQQHGVSPTEAVWSLSASPKLVLEEIFDVSIIPKETSDSKSPVNMNQ